MVNSEFKNKNYLLLGAANGLGRSLAFDLAEAKANLFLVDIDEQLKDLCQTLSQKTNCQGFVCDLSDYDRVVDNLVADNGFDGIIYFTRGRQKYDYTALEEKKWDNDLRLNVESPMYIIHQLWGKNKINKNASIVFLSSTCVQHSGAQSLSYGMSKAALESMCRYLAAEMGPNQVRVNTLQLGFIVKDEHKERFYSKDNDEYRFLAERVHPLRRVGHNKDVVGPIKFLLSEGSAFITGQVLTVDGGMTIPDTFELVQNLNILQTKNPNGKR